ncbi:hypothetical protein, partial [Bacteroides sp.]|uniref:hypothetical protein n=1 Tax=Bacteroides sp. TaxID=29523 RepID=UPI0026250C90
IGRVAVAIFNKDKSVNIIQEFTSTSGISVNCNPGTDCTGIVVANAPANHFAGVTTKDAFIAKIIDLTQTATALPMSGDIKLNTSTTFTLTAGATSNLTAEVSRLVARVAINSIKTAFEASGQYAKATFTAKKIFLHNANTKSNVDPGTTPVVSEPLSGKVDATNPGLQTALNQAITTAAHTTPYWFYTFAHNATTPTKLVIYGSFDADGAGTAATAKNVYYPVVVNKIQAGTIIKDGGTTVGSATGGKGDGTISRNSTYTITATIKGIGVDDPDDDINPAVLNLTVSVAGWALDISQDVTFN